MGASELTSSAARRVTCRRMSQKNQCHAQRATRIREILKAFLCFQHGLTVMKVAEPFRHDLAKLAAEVVSRNPDSDLALVQPNIENSLHTATDSFLRGCKLQFCPLFWMRTKIKFTRWQRVL